MASGSGLSEAVASARAQPAWRTVAAALAALEPIILLVLTPVVWYPNRLTAPALLAIPALWGVRRIVTGAFSVRTAYDPAMLLLMLSVPLTLLPVVRWDLATPRLLSGLLGVALVYALANAIDRESRLRTWTFAAVVGLGGAVAVVGLLGTDWLAPKILPLGALYNRLPQLIGGLSPRHANGALHPNQVAGVLTLLLPTTIAWLLARGRERAEWPWTLLAAIGALAMGSVLILTQSRGGVMGVSVAILAIVAWLVLVEKRFSRRPALRTAIVAVLAAATLSVLVVAIATWLGATPGTQMSLAGRLELWGLAVEMIQAFPFTGIGPGQYSLVLYTFYPPVLSPPSDSIPHAHNQYLQVLLEQGLVGAIAVAWLLIEFARNIRRGLAARGRLAPVIALGLGAGMLAFLVYGLTDAIALGARGSFAWWIVLGLAAGLGRLSDQADESR